MRYVGLIRNVMHGRQGLHRAVLLEHVAAAGARSAVTFRTTGNIAFDLDPDDLGRFVADLEDRLATTIGRREPVFVRSVVALRTLVAADPFAETPVGEVVERVVSFAKAPIPKPAALPVFSRRRHACVFRVDGREAYSVSQMIDGRTAGAGGLAEHLAGMPVTTRSWGTLVYIVGKEGA